MRPRRLIVLTMTLAGMLSGLAGASILLGNDFQMTPGYDTTVGFDAITVALLGRSNPDRGVLRRDPARWHARGLGSDADPGWRAEGAG